jgi:membrane-bound serine protease (ClpP class)
MTSSSPSQLSLYERRRNRVRGSERVLFILGIFLLALAVMPSPGAGAQTDDGGNVVIIPISGTIEPGNGHFLERAIGEAESANATTIILDIDTPGGRLDTVLEMRDYLLDTEIPVVAFVNREAFSAGALITIASDQIWMTPGSVFGAATPIDGATGETASEKTISAVRSVFRATADEQGRDPQIAEAMVDPSIEIEGLDSSTSLLTLTTEQALEHGYADGVAANSTVLLEELGLGNATVIEAEMHFWEHAVRWVTDPVFASLLILLGLGLIVMDGLVGGFGVAALAGVACLGLFFWGHQLAGVAGWEDLLLIGVGLLLIGLEVFVIPGFGVAGVSGLLVLIAGMVLAMTRRDFGDEGFAVEAVDVLKTLLITLSITVVVIIAFSLLLPRLIPSATRPMRGFQRLTLAATVDTGGRGAHQPGRLAKLFGGADTVTRDETGHTAMTYKKERDRETADQSRTSSEH